MTPAINCLKKAKIKYQVHPYDHDPASKADYRGMATENKSC